MRFKASIIIAAVLAAFVSWYAPWWTVAIVTFIMGLYFNHTGPAFLAGFLAIALMWLIAALIRDIPNDHLLIQKLSQLFKLPHYFLYVLITSLLGGFIGGMAGWSGAEIKKLLGSTRIESIENNRSSRN